jgi:hypothetical protein
VWNETGRIAMTVRVSTDVPPGVAVSHKGHWPRREVTRANVNVLNPGAKSDLGESSCVHGVTVTVSPMP